MQMHDLGGRLVASTANQLNMELTIESILSIGAPPPGFGTSR